ncbi:type II secretion system protein M [Kordiimonas sp. SCSIO 12603]|uniref:type II secretion system protein GspM n=1 Tax=Kordiimonas sp. SCSIO 12603 TaxID=2829596 RepID=UPI0021062D07|nr:type II secretion system protein GspM [Kordiimonas sp. SCSIO 12603]UTW58309.1 type II secretion system protein M [Kordiimonas sp. SCSIO 12603]
MREYLNNLTDRERNSLVLMAAVIVLFLLYFALYRPLQAGNASAERSIAAAERVFETVQKAAQLAKAVGSSAQGQNREKDDRPVRVIVAVTARANGVNITRIQPAESGSVTLWIDSVSPQHFYAWTAQLGNDHDISPIKVSMQKTGNTGSVRVQVQFEGPSR